jgi:hypothetical protein
VSDSFILRRRQQPPIINRISDFLCEEDARQAITDGEKIDTNAKTIITPAARDLGEAKDGFAR